MPEAWRIVRAQHAADAFSGKGAARYAGRWNSRGIPMVYCSSTRSLAALETLVHLNPLPQVRYVAFRLDFEGAWIESLPPGSLPADWRTQPPPASTRALGDAWARSQASAVLRVPSVIIPAESNYLLNPAHPDFARIVIHPPEDFVFDPRLLDT